MDSILPLTVLGAIIGLYAILPDYKKLRLVYSFGFLDTLMLSIIILLMLFSQIVGSYLSYETTVNLTTINLIFKQYLPTFNSILIANLINKPLSYQFLIDLINIFSIIWVLLFVIAKVWTKKIKINNPKYFIEKVDELFFKGDFTSVFYLIDDNYMNLMKFQIDTGERLPNIAFFTRATPGTNKLSIFQKVLNKINTLFKKTTYIELYKSLKVQFQKISEYFRNNDLIENIEFRLLDYNYIKNIVHYNPYFGLKILIDDRLDRFFREDFAHSYFKELMRNENSVLYREIQNTNEFVGSMYRYKISQNNKILYNVLSDIDITDENSLYAPLGDLTEELLENQGKKPDDIYNGYVSNLDISSPERLNDPIFMVIHFFDIMIREAIYQNKEWHMWLYYYDGFVRQISSNFRLTENSEPDYEFPNVYSVMLYLIIDNLISWIRLIIRDTQNVMKELRTDDCDHENENIIKSSIICLSICLSHILNSENRIPENFKLYLLNPIFRLYFALILNNNPIVNDYGLVLENCLLNRASESDNNKSLIIEAINRIQVHKLPITENTNLTYQERRNRFLAVQP
jgi:hypothetical protein